ncbi:MAG: tetratricopeptide repeat protein [Myxococcales bacterium]|nr:tetratricopeptide repeat protein [Myxococcales bacterium]
MTLRRLGIAALLATLPWLIYAPVGEHEFLVYDDRFYVSENPDLRLGLSPEGITAAFTRARGSNWVPLSSISWLVDVEIHDLAPGATQLGNVLLHSINVGLLFLVLSSLSAGSDRRGAEARSAFVAAVLAVHPVHVESVAWAVERRDSLAGLCWIATIAAYARYVRGPRTLSRYWPVPVGLGLGLLAKPTVVTLPFVLLLLDFWPLDRFRNGRGSVRAAWLDKLPLLALVAASAAGTFYLQQSFGSMGAEHPFGARFANALVAYTAYLRDAFWPAQLAIYYPHPGSSLPLWQPLLAALLLAGVSVAAVLARRRLPAFFVGWFWFVGVLVPVIGLVHVGVAARADRYLYLPLTGLAIALAWSLPEVLRGRRAAMGLGVAAVLGLGALGIRASQQVSTWHDSVTVFEHALGATDDNVVARVNLGDALIRRGRFDEAIEHLDRARELYPTLARPYTLLGYALTQTGQPEAAIVAYREALRRNPSAFRAMNNLAWLLATTEAPGQRNPDEAVRLAEQLVASLGVAPASVLDTLSLAYAAAGRADLARSTARRALEQAEAEGNHELAGQIRARIAAVP